MDYDEKIKLIERVDFFKTQVSKVNNLLLNHEKEFAETRKAIVDLQKATLNIAMLMSEEMMKLQKQINK